MIKKIATIVICSIAFLVFYIDHEGGTEIAIAYIYSKGDDCVFDLCFQPNFVEGPVKLRDNCIFYMDNSGSKCITVNSRYREKIVSESRFIERRVFGKNSFDVYGSTDGPDWPAPQVIFLVPVEGQSVISTISTRLSSHRFLEILRKLKIAGG